MPLNTLPILFLLVITLAACLPIDEDIPQCFPDESCPLGTVCIAGQCKAPTKHLIGIDASCLDQQCQETLTNYTSDESASDIDMLDICFMLSSILIVYCCFPLLELTLFAIILAL